MKHSSLETSTGEEKYVFNEELKEQRKIWREEANVVYSGQYKKKPL
jgi:hypothetical protein